jgi:hypothetical protein
MRHTFRFQPLIACLLAVAYLNLGNCQTAAAEEPQAPPAEAIEASIAQQLQGTWKLTAASWNTDTKQFADNTMYKIFTEDRFAFLWYDPASNSFTGAGGGTYTVDGNRFTEKIEYLSLDSTGVGTSQTYDFEILNGILHQYGEMNTTDFSNYSIQEFYGKVEPGIGTLEEKHPLIGVWNIEEASYGGEQHDIATRYGQVLKIITPGHFYGAFFNPETGNFNGVAFGSWEAQDDQYIETIKAYSWDDSAVGKTYAFDWKVEEGKFYQTGAINSDEYQDYEIREVSSRLE